MSCRARAGRSRGGRLRGTRVTSTDWLSYPILDITEAPEAIDIVLLNRPELPPAGAGESSIRPVAAALANAVFDATGVRLRRAPLTPERLKPAFWATPVSPSSSRTEPRP